jgi:hypothetical protein
VVSGCQCAQLPDVAFACEPGDDSCDAGALDAGLLDGGSDAGGSDAGAGPDAGALDAGGADAGLAPCNDWQCVQQGWVPTQSSVANPSLHDVGLDGGALGWFGGVLLPDGRVLAIAHTADTFVVFDPSTHEVTPFGPPAGEGILAGDLRKFAGGVLVGRRVYVFPYEARRVHELNLDDGGFHAIGPRLAAPDGGWPRYVGGVVDQFGKVWTVSEEALPLLRFDLASAQPDGGVDTTAFTVGGGYWGMVRRPDDQLLAFPKELEGRSNQILRINPSTTLMPAVVPGFTASAGLQGASLLSDGTVCATPAGLDSSPVCVDSSFGVTSDGGVHRSFGFNATGPDGLVWTAPDDLAEVLRISPQGISTTTLMVGSFSRYSHLGLVATPLGMVGIPGEPPHRFLLLPLSEKRPMRALLSPYFNKL